MKLGGNTSVTEAELGREEDIWTFDESQKHNSVEFTILPPVDQNQDFTVNHYQTF